MSSVNFKNSETHARSRLSATERIYLWVPRRWIVDIHYLTEGFEGLFVASTLDRKLGLMALAVARGGREAAVEVIDTIIEEYDGVRMAKRSEPELPT